MASSILATNAYLNPLLGTALSSVRAFSTNHYNYAKETVLDDSDPVANEIKASIERKSRSSVRAQQKKKRSRPDSPRAIQAKEKPQLLRELLPDRTPCADEPQKQYDEYEGLTSELLTTRLADLEARLAVAKAHDWDELYRNAQEEQSLKNQPGFKNLTKTSKEIQTTKARETFDTAISEIRKTKMEHEASMTKLQESIAALRSYIAFQKAGDDKSDIKTETNEVTGSEQKKRLEELKRRKEELLRKKDELAVKMAKLKAAKQGAIPTQTDKLDRKVQTGSSGETETAANAQTHELQSPSPPAKHSSIDPSQPTPLQTESLRLYLPGGKVKIDDDLTVDINAAASSLRRQISALQHRLKSFYPPLDDIPVNFEVKGKSLSAKNKYILKTWLKILVSRYQAKTGVQGVWEEADEQVQRVPNQTSHEQELSAEAKERMAKRWNGAFAAKRGYMMSVGEVQQRHEKEMEEISKEVEDDYADDHNEMGFLEDEYATEEELLAAQEEPKEQVQATSKITKRDEENREEDNLFDLSDEGIDAFVDVSSEKAKATKSAFSSTGQSSLQQTQMPKQDHQQGSDKGTVSQQPATMWDIGEAVPVPSSRPPFDSPEFEVWALHRLQNPPNDPKQSKEEATEIFSHNLQAVEQGWGDEDDKAAAKGIPIRAIASNHSKRSYSHMKPYDPRAPSGLAQMRAKGLIPKWAQEQNREYSTSSRPPLDQLNQSLSSKENSDRQKNASAPSTAAPPLQPSLPHLTPTGSAHMVSISSKSHTVRTAIAVGTVYFSNATPLSLITSNSLKKGDVLSVSRIAGIMAAKKCPDIVPLCHPIPLTHVGVELRTFPASSSLSHTATDSLSASADNMDFGGVQIECKVACTGATGVEMEALTAVMGTALSVVDMCKAVDKFQRIGDVRVVLKEGGKSGVWREEGWTSWQAE